MQTICTSAGASPGRPATPIAARAAVPASPSSSQRYSLAKSAIFEWAVKPSPALT